MTYTAEEIVSSTPFIILMILIAIFLIPLFIELIKALNPNFFPSSGKTGGKKRSKHLY
jgi:hypothetical protein